MVYGDPDPDYYAASIPADQLVELKRLKPWFAKKDLVICEEDYRVKNNRWFYTPNARGAGNAINYDDLLVRSASTFAFIGRFTNLKRVKVRRLVFSELKKFELVHGLEHLEIDLLGFHKDALPYLFDPIELPALKRLLIRESDRNLIADVKFAAPSLEAVYMGRSTVIEL